MKARAPLRAALCALGAAWLMLAAGPVEADIKNVKVSVLERCDNELLINARRMKDVEVKFLSRLSRNVPPITGTSDANGRALFQLPGVLYAISVKPPVNSPAELEWAGAEGKTYVPRPDTKLMEDFTVNRDIDLTIIMVRRGCGGQVASPPTPSPPPTPKPPPAGYGRTCGQALLTEHARLLAAKGLLENAKTKAQVAQMTSISTTREALTKLLLTGEQAIATLKSNAMDKQVRPEWRHEIPDMTSAARAVLKNQKSPFLGYLELEEGFKDQLDEVDLRVGRLRDIAGEVRCDLPADKVPPLTPNDQAVLLALQPPLYFAGGEQTDPRVTNDEGAAALYKVGETLSMSKEPLVGASASGPSTQRKKGTVIQVSLKPGAGRTLVTPEARIVPDGTAYLVHRDAERALTFVYVLEGSVTVTPKAGKALRLAAGQAALATAQGVRPLRPAAGSPGGAEAQNPQFETDTNRNGSSYANFDLSAPDPQQCFDRCRGDNSCRAWTYVKPGVQGPNARCYLKNPAPPATPNACCVSGTIPRVIDQQANFEVDVNRIGSDYTSFDLPSANPDLCFERCRGDARCAAWTFVRPGVQGSPARCYLKDPAPAPSANTCCVSGVIARAAPPITPSPPVRLPNGDTRYDTPAVNGVLLDHCASWGSNCGQGGADAFCRRQGHGPARSFQVRNPGRTFVPGDNGGICEGGNCVGFTQVVCAGAATAPAPTPPVQLPNGDVRYDNPSVNGVLLDHCASWGSNCGQGGADAFCRRQGHGPARSFQTRNPGRTFVPGDNGGICEGGNCVGFTQVVCAGAGQVSPPSPPPPTPPQLPPPPPPGAVGVTWFTSAKDHVNSPDGQRFSYTCPPLGADGALSIWGTDIYTYDSGICLAGVHTGVITRERGGTVTIEMRPGQSSYTASPRNGIPSQGYGPYNKSFAVVTGAGYRVPPPPPSTTTTPPSTTTMPSPLPPAAQLGQVWAEIEETEHATWTRRPGTNVFDGSWSNGRVRAVLEMSLLGNQVLIRRTQSTDGYDCIYSGIIEGKQASGIFSCNRFSGQKPWRATIDGGGAPAAQQNPNNPGTSTLPPGVKPCTAGERASFAKMAGSWKSVVLHVTISGSCEQPTGKMTWAEYCSSVSDPKNTNRKYPGTFTTGKMEGGSLAIGFFLPGQGVHKDQNGTASCSLNSDGTLSCRGFGCGGDLKKE